MPIYGIPVTAVFYLSTVCIVDVNYNKGKIVDLSIFLNLCILRWVYVTAEEVCGMLILVVINICYTHCSL